MLLGKLIKKIKPAYKSIRFNNIRFNSKDCKTNDIFFSIQGNKLNGNKNAQNPPQKSFTQVYPYV